MAVQVSVIIPIYNAAATLQAAAESVLSQDMTDLELLLIDDGSTDATPLICHRLAAADSRVQVVAQKNAGICAARNRGLQLARGEYIAFCDDDDAFLPGALALLLQTARETNADLVRGGYQLLRRRKNGSLTPLPHPAGAACGFTAGQGGYGAYLQNSGPQFVWNALYRRAAIAGLHFDERCRYGLEDFVFNAAVHAKIQKAVFLPQPVYRHYEDVQSTSLCRTLPALRGRIRALPLWVRAERAAAVRLCAGREIAAVWNARSAQFVTFLMHQLRDAGAPAAVRRHAWRTLRTALAHYPAKPLDILCGAGQNKKQTLALLLYRMRLQRLYELWPNSEEMP